MIGPHEWADFGEPGPELVGPAGLVVLAGMLGLTVVQVYIFARAIYGP